MFLITPISFPHAYASKPSSHTHTNFLSVSFLRTTHLSALTFISEDYYPHSYPHKHLYTHPHPLQTLRPSLLPHPLNAPPNLLPSLPFSPSYLHVTDCHCGRLVMWFLPFLWPWFLLFLSLMRLVIIFLLTPKSLTIQGFISQRCYDVRKARLLSTN